MSLAGYAFVQGFTGDVRNSIEKREEAERDRKKSQFLEQLRRDTYKWQAEYDAARAKSQSDKNMTQFDYDKGVKILKNSDGDTIREVPLTKSEIDAYRLDRRGTEAKLTVDETKAKYADRLGQLDIAQAEAQIESSRASAANSRASAAATRHALSSADGVFGTSGAAKAERRVQEILSRNEDIAEGLKAAGIPEENIQQLAAEALIQASQTGDPAAALRIFREGAGRLRAKGKNASYNTRRGLEDMAPGGNPFATKP